MNILLVAAEYAPYLSQRSSAESVANLAKALRLIDHSVTVVVPRDEAYEQAGLVAARGLTPLSVADAGQNTDLAYVHELTLPNGVRLAQLQMLGSDSRSTDVTNRARFLRQFGQAAAAFVAAQAGQGTPFDVVHAHDCEAGMALLSVKDAASVKVLTVHDAGFAGVFPRALASELGLADEYLSSHGFGLGEEISLLKGLLSQADAVIVPSENYGQKLKEPEHHGAMARAFQAVDLSGILEGVDQALFNPATDPSLNCRYDAACPENKGRNRAAVLDRLELEFDPERPIVFAEFDPTGDPGWSTLINALPAIMRNQVTLILLGDEALDSETVATFSGCLKSLKVAEASERRQLLAAADFYLSLRRKDPNGRALMQASRYGAVPIAYLVDSVPDLLVDCDMELETGNAILFDAMTQRALQTAIARAARAYRSPRWSKLLSRVMRRDLAWDRSARRHVQVYKQLVKAR